VAELLVDGMNVIGSRPDGWWRDRDGAARRLLTRLQALSLTSEEVITLVLEGRPLADVPEGAHNGVVVRYARRRGRNAADDRIVELVEAASDPAAVRVVTSDRALRERAERLGARVEGAGALLARLDALRRE
jgi:predicted RNA-binding protein with PIN domain